MASMFLVLQVGVAVLLSTASTSRAAAAQQPDVPELCSQSIAWAASGTDVKDTEVLRATRDRCVDYFEGASVLCVAAKAAFVECIEGMTWSTGRMLCAPANSRIDLECPKWREEIFFESATAEQEDQLD